MIDRKYIEIASEDIGRIFYIGMTKYNIAPENWIALFLKSKTKERYEKNLISQIFSKTAVQSIREITGHLEFNHYTFYNPLSPEFYAGSISAYINSYLEIPFQTIYSYFPIQTLMEKYFFSFAHKTPISQIESFKKQIDSHNFQLI